MSAYDLDLHAWAQEQASALRRRSANEIDWENVAEEIESLGGQQEQELYNRLHVLLTHLLKWAYQPERRGRSWLNTIREQRKQVERLIRKNPSLKSVQESEFADAYVVARTSASTATDLDLAAFPAALPFTLEQALTEDWLPEAAVTAAERDG